MSAIAQRSGQWTWNERALCRHCGLRPAVSESRCGDCRPPAQRSQPDTDHPHVAAGNAKVMLSVTLKDLRQDRGLSQGALARLSGVGDKTISTYETGSRSDRIKLDQLAAICDAMGVTLSEFFREVEKRRAW